MNRKLLTVALLFILVGIVGILVVGKGLDKDNVVIGEEKFNSEDISDVVIRNSTGEIKVRPSKDDDIHVNWKANLRFSKEPKIEIKESDGRLSVEVKERKSFRIEFFSFNFKWNSYEIEVHIPESSIERLIVDSSVGDVSVEGVNMAALEIESEVADVTVRNMVVSMTDITTDVGDIDIENIEGDISVKSDVGEISVINPGGNLMLRSDVGDIYVKAPEIKGDFSIKNDVGDIELLTEKDQKDASIFTSSEIGSIKVYGNEKRYFVNGAPYIIELDTDVGDVKVSAIK